MKYIISRMNMNERSPTAVRRTSHSVRLGGRLEVLAEAAVLIGLVAHEAEHGQEVGRVEIAGHARHLGRLAATADARRDRRPSCDRRDDGDRPRAAGLWNPRIPRQGQRGDSRGR